MRLEGSGLAKGGVAMGLAACALLACGGKDLQSVAQVDAAEGVVVDVAAETDATGVNDQPTLDATEVEVANGTDATVLDATLPDAPELDIAETADAALPDQPPGPDLPDVATSADTVADANDAQADTPADAGPLPAACTPYVAALPKPVTPGYLDYLPLRPCTPENASKACHDENMCTDDACVNGFCLHKFNVGPCNEPCGTKTGVCEQGSCGKPGTTKYWAKTFLDSKEWYSTLDTKSIVALPDGGAILGGVGHPVYAKEFGSYVMAIDVNGHLLRIRESGWGEMSARLPNGTIATARWGAGNAVALYDGTGTQLWQSSPEYEGQPESATDPMCVWAGYCGTFGMAPAGCDSVAYVGGAATKFTFPNGVPTGTDAVPFIGVIGPNGKLKWRVVGMPKQEDYVFAGVAEVEGGTLIAAGSVTPDAYSSAKMAFAATGFSPDGKVLWHQDLGMANTQAHGIIAMTSGIALVYGQHLSAPELPYKIDGLALVRINAAGVVVGKSMWSYEGIAKLQLGPQYAYRLHDGHVVLQVHSMNKVGRVDLMVAPDGAWVREGSSFVFVEPKMSLLSRFAAPSGPDLFLRPDSFERLERTPPSGFVCVPAQKCDGVPLHGCNDSNPCTMDYCLPASGCVHDLKPDGSACSIGQVCLNGKCGG